MLGGFLKQMNDSLKQNKALRGNKVNLNELYRERFDKREASFDIDDINERIEYTQQRSKAAIKSALMIKLITMGIIIALTIIVMVALSH